MLVRGPDVLPSQPTPVGGPQGPAIDKPRAQALLAEARRLQGQGMLMEARQKALEAQHIGAFFGPEEDTPELALVSLIALCDQRINGLLVHATDMAQMAADPARLQKAEADLAQARQLAVVFGVDTQAIDNKIAWLRNQGGLAPQFEPVNGGPAGVAQATQRTQLDPSGNLTAHAQGMVLLDNARREFKAGQTATARRFAEEALKEQYGVQDEAARVLRSLDAEEFNQAQFAAARAVDAGIAAYQRRDFAQAASIFQSVDVKLLSPDKQSRLKEMMLMPEMAAARVGAALANRGPEGQVPAGQPVPVEGAAMVRVSDQGPAPGVAGGEEFTESFKAMQEIKLQELRERAMEIQRNAMACFKAGDTTKSLELLTDFLNSLSDARIDTEKVALVRRPVEVRLQTLKKLKAEKDFESEQVARRDSDRSKLTKLALADRQKQEQVADLMKQYRTFYKEGKYKEAEFAAAKALEVDPDNIAADAAVHLSRMHRNMTESHNTDRRREDLFIHSINDAVEVGPEVSASEPVHYDPKRTAISRNRKGLPAEGIWSATRNVQEQNIERRLKAPINLNFKDTPLGQVIDDLHDLSGVNVVPDKAALEEAGISMDRPLSLKLEGVSMKSALNVLLQQLHLTYVVKDEVLQITTEEHAKGKLKQVTYPVADLVVPVDNHTMPISANLEQLLDKKIQNEGAVVPLGSAPYTGPYSLPPGQPVGSMASTGGFTPAGSTPPSSPVTATVRGPGQTIEDVLINLITNTVAPQSWSDVGGPGTIKYFPLGLALVINQTQDIQEQIADLLAALRRLQDLEVTIEVRLITVAEAFFERIGMDFNINIVNDNTKQDPLLLTQQFQPFGFINAFRPNQFTTGLTPAETFTPDLNIPVRNSSFTAAIPPFGGFPGTIGQDGGLSVGVAFLSDIQVFMFMEAAQGDRRTNVMQAPKLTLFNGQTSTINVSDQQFFLTGVSVAAAGSQIFFIPANTPFPTGVSLTMNAVISADRRYVRVSPTLTISNLASAIVPLIPVQVPVPTFFEAPLGPIAANEPTIFQMFFQQPTFTTVNINTTVQVPDGGTVLLGGIKTLSEGRNEFGPPVLSKIPYINRLFKNVGFGREAQSLMIMITPRIIINEEEAIAQTGVP
jgi:type II secretory pathway component GspD/PulD (secretin)